LPRIAPRGVLRRTRKEVSSVQARALIASLMRFERERDTHTERHTDKEEKRETETETETETERERQRERERLWFTYFVLEKKDRD
jgi:hypothetical protein